MTSSCWVVRAVNIFAFDLFSTLGALSNEIKQNLNCQSLEVVSRYRDPQLQVTENLCSLWNSRPNIYQCFKIESIILFLTTGYTSAIKNTECQL